MRLTDTDELIKKIENIMYTDEYIDNWAHKTAFGTLQDIRDLINEQVILELKCVNPKLNNPYKFYNIDVIDDVLNWKKE